MELTPDERTRLLAEISDAAFHGALRGVREWARMKEQRVAQDLFDSPEAEAHALLERQSLKSRRLARASTESLRMLARELATTPEEETPREQHRRCARLGLVFSELTARGLKVAL